MIHDTPSYLILCFSFKNDPQFMIHDLPFLSYSLKKFLLPFSIGRRLDIISKLTPHL